MKKIFKLIAITIFALTMFVSCGKKNPVSGKKFELKINGLETVTYVFSDDKMWLDGLEEIKLDYRYDEVSNSIIMIEYDGIESTIPMSQLKLVSKK